MLKQLYKTEKDVRMKIRLLVILYFFEGYSNIKVTKLVHQSSSTLEDTSMGIINWDQLELLTLKLVIYHNS